MYFPNNNNNTYFDEAYDLISMINLAIHGLISGLSPARQRAQQIWNIVALSTIKHPTKSVGPWSKDVFKTVLVSLMWCKSHWRQA